MEEFLSSVERRAFRMAQFATGNTEEALDIVQDSMFTLVRRYDSKPANEWRPLFFRILQNRIRDWHRRNTVRRAAQVFLPGSWKGDEGEGEDPIAGLADPAGKDPGDQAANRDSAVALESALGTLPWRQQQAFLLRAWEELSVSEAAAAMRCSEGTVKTHYSRAISALREMLGDHWP